jgi:hypothetical protein
VITWDHGIKRWKIRNVGNGPALNITVAQRATRGDGAWYNPVTVPSIESGGSFIIEWLGSNGEFALGARYCDFLDYAQESKFFAYTSSDRSEVYLPGDLPPWAMPISTPEESKRFWEAGISHVRPEVE